jgi:WD40 repeat protein/uncharacterized caspase-like protein
MAALCLLIKIIAANANNAGLNANVLFETKTADSLRNGNGFILPDSSKNQLKIMGPSGHALEVNAVAISPDGKLILSASSDKTLILWDYETGNALRVFSGHLDAVDAVAFSPDGITAASGSADSTIKIWDLETGKEIRTLKGHTDKVVAIAFSPDGQTILSGSWDNTVKLWQVSSGQLICSLTDERVNEWVTSVAFSPDGTKAVSGHFLNSLVEWDLKSCKALQILKIENKKTYSSPDLYSVAYSPDGSKVVAAAADHNLHMWELQSGKEILTFIGHTDDVYAVAFSTDGKKILSGSYDYTLKLWDAESGNEIRSFPGHKYFIHSVAISPKGDFAVSASWDHTLKVWNLVTGKLQKSLQTKTYWTSSCDFSSDWKTMVMASDSGTLKQWDLSRGKEVSPIVIHPASAPGLSTFYREQVDPETEVVISPDGSFAIINSTYGENAKLYDLASGKVIRNFPVNNTFNALAISPDGKQLAANSNQGTLAIWNTQSDQVRILGNNSPATYLAMAFSSDGGRLITTDRDSYIRVWDLSTGKEKLAIPANKDQIHSISISPDGKKLITAGFYENKLTVWDLEKGNKLRSIEADGIAFSCVTFSPDGRHAVSACRDKSLRYWDTETGKCLKVLKGHTDVITQVKFYGEKQIVLTVSLDNTFKFWDIDKEKELCSIMLIDSADWVVVTPENIFDASPGAMRQMYFTKGMHIIELAQLKERYYEPGLLPKILGFNSEPIRVIHGLNEIELFPRIDLEEPGEDGTLRISLKNQGGGLGKVQVLINGKEMINDARPKGLNADTNRIILTLSLKGNPLLVEGHLNEIAVKAYNKAGYLESRESKVLYNPGLSQHTSYPRLFIVSCGISDYSGDQIDLRFASKDAEDITHALVLAARRLFGADKTYTYLLNTGDVSSYFKNMPDFKKSDPTRKNIISTFEEISHIASSNDILVVYLSGHGINLGGQEGDWYYLTREAYSNDLAAYNDPAIRKATTLSSSEFVELIKKVPALKQVLIIDACASGKMLENLMIRRDISSTSIRALDRMKDRTGMHIITGCTADAVSYESNRFGQGILTYSLLEGMKGTALREDKFVDISKLFQSARERVPELAEGIGGIQKPEVFSPYGAESFDIGMFTTEDKDSIPLSKSKPMFTMTMLQDEDSFDDVLHLGSKVDELLRDLTARGARAPLIFLETREFPSAYRLLGRYTQKEDSLTVKINIFKGNEKIKSLEINGDKLDMQKLTGNIVDQVCTYVK